MFSVWEEITMEKKCFVSVNVYGSVRRTNRGDKFLGVLSGQLCNASVRRSIMEKDFLLSSQVSCVMSASEI